MDNQELRDLRERIKFDMRSFASCLGIPHTTLQRYEDSTAQIPPNIERAAMELEEIEKQFDVARLRVYDDYLAKQCPYGIISAPVEEFC